MTRVMRWWRGVNEANRRETDERHRLISLLALRDGFYVVMFLLVGYTLLTLLTFADGRLDDLAGFWAQVLSLSALPVAFLVMGVSGYARGASAGPGKFAYNVIVVVPTMIVVYVSIFLLRHFRVLESGFYGLPDLIGSLIGIAIGAGLFFLIYRHLKR